MPPQNAPRDVTEKHPPVPTPREESHSGEEYLLSPYVFHPLAQLQAMMSRLESLSPGAAAVARTAVDVHELSDAFEFVADVPGLTREDVVVQVHDGNVLTISGERRMEEASEEAPPAEEGQPSKGEEQPKEREADRAVSTASRQPYRRVERSFGKFVRSFSLPRNADLDNVKATVTKGVLTVRVPKKPVADIDPAGRVNIEWSEL